MRIIKNIALFISLIILSIGVANAQKAKKPRVMVVPSDALLLEKGLLSSNDDLGEENFVQNYNKALLDMEIKSSITKFGEMMAERGFTATDLEQMLKKKQNNPNFIVPIDIKVDLSYKSRKVGPRVELYFELKGIDSYSGKQIAAASGSSQPAIGASVIELLQEAVIDKIDPFNSQLQNHFEDMLNNGAETTIILETKKDIDDIKVGNVSLLDFIEDWMTKNCMNSVFSTDQADGNVIQISQARMPLFTSEGRAQDARLFYSVLSKELKSKGIKNKINQVGMGEVKIKIN